jgi:hypothetical protein
MDGHSTGEIDRFPVTSLKPRPSSFFCYLRYWCDLAEKTINMADELERQDMTVYVSVAGFSGRYFNLIFCYNNNQEW